jgi:hypothetical protein
MASPSPRPSDQMRQVALSYAMEQARLPNYENISTTEEIILSADSYYDYIVDGTVPDIEE